MFSDFIINWLVSRAMPSAGKLDNLIYPKNKALLRLKPRHFSTALCTLNLDLFAGAPASKPGGAPDDVLVYFVKRFPCEEPMDLEVRLGYDGPIKVWIDGRQMFHDPKGTNPARLDSAIIPWDASRGTHELMIALGSNNGKAWGMSARFRRTDRGSLKMGLPV